MSEYQVERIAGKRNNERGQLEYKVKWVGYPDSQSTWEPLKHLTGAERAIELFHKKREGPRHGGHPQQHQQPQQ